MLSRWPAGGEGVCACRQLCFACLVILDPVCAAAVVVLVVAPLVTRGEHGPPEIVQPSTRRNKRGVQISRHRGLVELRVDVVFDLIVFMGQARPVHGGIEVMDGMEAVVEREEVHQCPREVAAGVVIDRCDGVGCCAFRLLLAAVVLDQVHGHNCPLCEEVG